MDPTSKLKVYKRRRLSVGGDSTAAHNGEVLSSATHVDVPSAASTVTPHVPTPLPPYSTTVVSASASATHVALPTPPADNYATPHVPPPLPPFSTLVVPALPTPPAATFIAGILAAAEGVAVASPSIMFFISIFLYVLSHLRVDNPNFLSHLEGASFHETPLQPASFSLRLPFLCPCNRLPLLCPCNRRLPLLCPCNRRLPLLLQPETSHPPPPTTVEPLPDCIFDGRSPLIEDINIEDLLVDNSTLNLPFGFNLLHETVFHVEPIDQDDTADHIS
ncbi:hypothetical protein OROMI_031682 [Orobanche minor]